MLSLKRVSILVALAFVCLSVSSSLASAQSAGANPTGGTTCQRYDDCREGSGFSPSTTTWTSSLVSGARFWTGLTLYRMFAPSLITTSRAAYAPSTLVRRRAAR